MADSRVAHLREYLNTELIPYFISQGMSKVKARHTALAYLKDSHPDVYQKVVPVKKQYGSDPISKVIDLPELPVTAKGKAKRKYGLDKIDAPLDELSKMYSLLGFTDKQYDPISNSWEEPSEDWKKVQEIGSVLSLPIGMQGLAVDKATKAARPLLERLKNLRKRLPKFNSKAAQNKSSSSAGVPDMSLEDFSSMSINDKVDFLATVQSTISNKSSQILTDLRSPIGKERLIAQFKKADPSLQEKELELLYNTRVNAVEGSLSGNRAKWVVERAGQYKQPYEFLQDLDLPTGSGETLWQQYFPYRNARASRHPLFIEPTDPSIGRGSSSSTSGVNLQKESGFLNPDSTPGHITLGKGYEKSGPTVSHEAGHLIQRGSKMPIDDELRSLMSSYLRGRGNKVKGYADDVWRQFFSGHKNTDLLENSVGYFIKGSKGKEPYPFLREARDVMLEKGVIKSTHEPITAKTLKTAKNLEKGITGDNRLLFMIPPWDRAKLAKVWNTAPAAAPIGAGLGAAAALQSDKTVPKSQMGGPAGRLTIPHFANRESEPDYNASILQLADSLEGGGYNWDPSGSGSPYDIEHNSAKILAKQAEGTYCSGYTCGVSLKAMQDSGLLKDLDDKQLADFKQIWYGAKDYKKGDKESLSTAALQKYGLGYEVPHESAKPGDIAQIWRKNGSGHSVIFKDWVYDDDKNVVGIKYRSTQKATKGVGDRTEMFGDKIDPSQIYLARIGKQNRPPLRKKGALSKKRK